MSILILLALCLLPGTTHPLCYYKAIWFGMKQDSSYTAPPFLTLSLVLTFSLFYFLLSLLCSLVAQPEPPEKQLLNQLRESPNSFSRSPPGLNRPHMKVGKSSCGVFQVIICSCCPLVLCHGEALFVLKSHTCIGTLTATVNNNLTVSR